MDLQIDRTSCCLFSANAVARLPDRRGLRAHAGTAIAGGAYCVCPQPGDVAARPAS